jgi:hypothetical protein
MQIVLGLHWTDDTENTGEDCVKNYERVPRAHSIITFLACHSVLIIKAHQLLTHRACEARRASNKTASYNIPRRFQTLCIRRQTLFFTLVLRHAGGELQLGLRILTHEPICGEIGNFPTTPLASPATCLLSLALAHIALCCADKKQQSVISGAHLTLGKINAGRLVFILLPQQHTHVAAATQRHTQKRALA